MPKRDEVAFVVDALALETEEALSAGTLGYYGRVFCQCSLPYQDPGDVALWTREAGRLSLTVQPAVVRDPVTGALVTRYPYGTPEFVKAVEASGSYAAGVAILCS